MRNSSASLPARRCLTICRSLQLNMAAASRSSPHRTAPGRVIPLPRIHSIGWSKRIRLALNDPGYVIQPYDAAAWVERETPVDGLAALEAYLALRKLNMPLYRGIGDEERRRAFRHPEFGEMSIDWILRTLAGHDLHHLKQLEAVRP